MYIIRSIISLVALKRRIQRGHHNRSRSIPLDTVTYGPTEKVCIQNPLCFDAWYCTTVSYLGRVVVLFPSCWGLYPKIPYTPPTPWHSKWNECQHGLGEQVHSKVCESPRRQVLAESRTRSMPTMLLLLSNVCLQLSGLLPQTMVTAEKQMICKILQ